MARQSTSGQPRNVAPITGNYDINEDDDYVTIGPGWLGGTITLPGPGSNHPSPNNGDQYTIADPAGLVTAPHTLTINGGGFNFFAAGALVASAAYTNFISSGNNGGETAMTNCAMKFTFEALRSIWIVEF
jgi:hypothetical protein